ncbi:unnamed protein product [Rotaria socialis]|uniref:Uncharacterized protein n=1 Tax=Rotaria socialis TaxID=392032 RepID=A0A817TV74_9BILA|nr:unnamed protein product [Rotaria socialis]CAF4605725.1 unnamed protein product [Rotaria socialis]
MLKNIVHSYHGKLHTFDDFYRNDSNPIKSRLSSNDLTSTNNCPSPSPTSPCSPNSNPYTFYNVFSDFKYSTAPDVVPEEDETEDKNEIIEPDSNSATAVFYLEDDHNSHPQISASSSSPNWPSLIFHRFRHSNNNNNNYNYNNTHSMVKQMSINENQMNLTKSRKNDHIDSSINKHRYLKRSETITHTNGLTDRKTSGNNDFLELSLSTTNDVVKKHRSFASLFNYFHHSHHQNLPTKNPGKSNSIDTLHLENLNLNNNDFSRPKLIKQKPLPSSNEIYSPVTKSPPKPILPKLASLFHRNHSSEQHIYRVGNLKARLHHRRHSPPLTNTAPKFQCQDSNELIQEIKRSEDEQHQDNDHHISTQRPVKPVVMKRVHTWHNTFDLRPVDQCLEY